MTTTTVSGLEVQLTPSDRRGSPVVRVELDYPDGRMEFLRDYFGAPPAGGFGIIGSWRDKPVCVAVSRRDFMAVMADAEDLLIAAESAEADTNRTARRAEAEAMDHPVLLVRWSEACDDPSEECDLDNVSQYIRGDGTTFVRRTHSW